MHTEKVTRSHVITHAIPQEYWDEEFWIAYPDHVLIYAEVSRRIEFAAGRGNTETAALEDAGFTAETVIDSPRHIADGRGSWRGTIREAIEAELQNPAGTALGNLESRLRAEGKLPEVPDDAEDPDEFGFDVDRDAHLLAVEHLRDLLDDPDATVIA